MTDSIWCGAGIQTGMQLLRHWIAYAQLTLGAHATRGLQYLVYVCVCQRLFWHYRL